MYPRIIIDTKRYEDNLINFRKEFDEKGFSLMIVTKAYCADLKLVEIAAKYGDFIGDSRIKNIKSMKDIKIPKALIRLPMLSEIEDVIKYADISFNSEIKTLNKLNEEAKKQNKKHRVVIMIDIGDLREGFFYEDDFYNTIEKIMEMENLILFGIATNLTCYGGVLPSKENLEIITNAAKTIENKYTIKLPFVSGGNTSSLPLFHNNEIPKGINNLRLGESTLRNYEIINGELVYKKIDDVFTVEGEVIELKEKPSLPIGKIGIDAFGDIPVFEDKGIRKRGIIGIGRQDINYETIFPLDNRIKILGASSDHLILDMTETGEDYDIGSIVDFGLEYSSIFGAWTSKYVQKVYI